MRLKVSSDALILYSDHDAAEQAEPAAKQKTKRVKRFSNSDSEDENLKIDDGLEDQDPRADDEHSSTELQENEKKRAREDDDSDSDEEIFNMPLKMHKKTKCIPILDDEDESE